MVRIETLVTAQHGQNNDRIQNFLQALPKNSPKWLKANPSLTARGKPKARLLETFGKTRFELDLAGESAKLLASGDLLGYTFHVLNHIISISPNATEKKNRIVYLSGCR